MQGESRLAGSCVFLGKSTPGVKRVCGPPGFARARQLRWLSLPEGCAGEGEQESAAVVEFAFGADGAAVGEHDVFGDREA